MIGIARWESKDHLEGFWRQAGTVQFPGATMESIEILEELDHLTVEQVDERPEATTDLVAEEE